MFSTSCYKPNDEFSDYGFRFNICNCIIFINHSIIRQFTPKHIRMMVQVLIISAYVIIVDIFLKAYLPEMSKALGPYVGLIITNCIIMGRAEAYAQKIHL